MEPAAPTCLGKLRSPRPIPRLRSAPQAGAPSLGCAGFPRCDLEGALKECHNREVSASTPLENLQTRVLGAQRRPPASQAPTPWSRTAPTHAEPGGTAAPPPGPASDWR